MIRELLWRMLAWLVSRDPVADHLISRALRRPYGHIYGRDGSMYMGRWWLFNPYPEKGEERRFVHRLPSVRVHCILRPDQDPDKHDHPWDARTLILKGWYREDRLLVRNGFLSANYLRNRGYTGAISFGEFHRITEVSPEAAWTIFITWGKQGSWGFSVNGSVIPWREYLFPNALSGVAP